MCALSLKIKEQIAYRSAQKNHKNFGKNYNDVIKDLDHTIEMSSTHINFIITLCFQG